MDHFSQPLPEPSTYPHPLRPRTRAPSAAAPRALCTICPTVPAEASPLRCCPGTAKISHHRARFLLDSVRCLKARLRAAGSDLLVPLHCRTTAVPCSCTSLPFSPFLVAPLHLPFTAFLCVSTSLPFLVVPLPSRCSSASLRWSCRNCSLPPPAGGETAAAASAIRGLYSGTPRSVWRNARWNVLWRRRCLFHCLSLWCHCLPVPCVASAFSCGTTAFQCLPFPPVPSIPSSAFQRAFQRAFQCALQYSLWCQCLAVLSVPFLAMPLPSRCVRLGARSSSCAGAAAHCIMWMTCCSAAEGRLGARRQRTKTTTRTKMKTSRIWTCRRRMPRRQWQWRRLR